MKRRLLAVLLSLTLAGTFMACGGSKEGAETATVADQSISDISTVPTVTQAPTDSKTTAGDATASQVTKPASTDSSTTTESGQSDVITPIPAQEITDGTAVAGTTAGGTAGTAAGSTTAADGTTADGTTAEGTQGTTNSQQMVTTADINVREEADFEGDILGGYDEGDEITVVGAEGEWYIVEYNGEKGYVYSKYLKSAGASTGSTGSSSESSEDSDSEYSKYGRLVDGDGDPVNLQYYDGSYEIYDEDGNQVFIEGVND
ncbi:MAG TPA: hypothetical protein DCX23_02360 [Lachnospiraceae bacterium]|nr:hypothetical protein [Lachnospiraceae bacterium]